MLNRIEVKKRRKKLKLSFAAAAQAAGWKFSDRARWYAIETGRKKEVTATTLCDMARALQCTPNELLKF